jgi:hypothetical protein
MLPHFSRHGLSRQITVYHALSRDFVENKRLFIFYGRPKSTHREECPHDEDAITN